MSAFIGLTFVIEYSIIGGGTADKDISFSKGDIRDGSLPRKPGSQIQHVFYFFSVCPEEVAVFRTPRGFCTSVNPAIFQKDHVRDRTFASVNGTLWTI